MDESVQPSTTFPSFISSERQLEFQSIRSYCILFYHSNAGIHTTLNALLLHTLRHFHIAFPNVVHLPILTGSFPCEPRVPEAKWRFVVISFSANPEGEQVIYQQSRPMHAFPHQSRRHQRLRFAPPPSFRFV